MAPVMKRRRLHSQQPEEIVFDASARQDYLTGFHKRKEARKQHARDAAIKREKQDRVKERKQLREQRRVDLEKHMSEFNAELRKHNPDLASTESETQGDEGDREADEWTGIDEIEEQMPAGDEEYVDEDKYTTVTVEPIGNSEEESDDQPTVQAEEDVQKDGDGAVGKKKRIWTRNKPTADGKPKQKKHKFRYESKAERQDTRRKQKSKSKAAKARRDGSKV